MTRMQNYFHYLKQLFETNPHQLFCIHKYLISHDNVYWRIISVSGKLPTYPSPKPTLTPTSHLRQNVVLGEEAGGQFPRNIMIVFKCSWEYEVLLEGCKTIVYAKLEGKQKIDSATCNRLPDIRRPCILALDRCSFCCCFLFSFLFALAIDNE